MFQRIFSFFDGSMPRQVFFSKLARAAATARSTSHASPSGTVVSSSPVAGFMTSMVLPLVGVFPASVDEQFAGVQLLFDFFSNAHSGFYRSIQQAGRGSQTPAIPAVIRV